MARECTEEVFLKDIAHHQITIIRDDGVHRHLRFAKPGTGCMHFELVTWPGYIAYSGDMGCFVFQRTRDMFEFFRDSAPTLRINPRYWGEKLQAESRYGGFKEFSKEFFRAAVTEYLDDAEASAELRQEVDHSVLSKMDDGEHAACQALYDFEHDGFHFEDFFERTIHDYTFHFIWCCYALVWGIRQYDSAKAAAPLPANVNPPAPPGPRPAATSTPPTRTHSG